jgi:hypothetical protein
LLAVEDDFEFEGFGGGGGGWWLGREGLDGLDAGYAGRDEVVEVVG